MGWAEEYKNQHTKTVMRCAKHGEWTPTVTNFTSIGRRCPKCGISSVGERKRIPRSEYAARVAAVAISDGFTFVGWDGDYIGTHTRAIIHCTDHGEWFVNAANFVIHGNRCPACSIRGYKQSSPGILYALVSSCESIVKIGITNNIKRRVSQLRRSTPFDFSFHRELSCANGMHPVLLERIFHDQFPSAGLTGFDGATEWRQMSPDVTTWLDLLQ